MGLLSVCLKLCLLNLCLAGLYTTWYLFLSNGTYSLMIHVRDVGPQVLPGTNAPLKRSYTGIEKLDYQLTVLALFFWELIDGSRPNASLQCFHFVGQITAGWGLLMMEALRNGNRKRIISFLAVWGILMQNYAFDVIIPLYLLLHLSTSPTVSSNDPNDFHIDLFNLSSIPFSMAIGLILPTVLAALPSPSIISFDRKQSFMAIWQMFPLWVQLLQLALPFLFKTFYSSLSRKPPSSGPRRQGIGALRFAYIFMLTIAASTHIATLTLLFTSKFFPALFATPFIGVFNPANVFWPVTMSASHQMSSIGSGAMLVIQYDEIIGSVAVVLWALFLLTTALQRFSSQVGVAGSTTAAWAVIFDFVTFTALVGPLGYAVIAMWSRDELIFASGAERTNDQKAK
ncbi:hypothetical protein MMC07_007641 [Pseudocyphellaria aurata]|nr:hypothetical protein [Pseudocyphellaria aurata]